MKNIFIAALLFLGVACCAGKPECRMTPMYPPPASTALEWTTINLDLPPQERWAAAVAPLAGPILAMIMELVNLIPEPLRTKILANLDHNASTWVDHVPAPYGDEMRGIAAATGIDLGLIFLYNIAYELEGGCTSIVAQDSTGQLLHGRNLDFGLFFGWDKANHTWKLAELLRPLLVNVRFVSKGATVFNSTYFAGYVGLLTGFKTSGFSITVDTRFDKNFWHGLLAWLDGNYTAQFLSFTTRTVMMTAASYGEALLALNNTLMVGPSYIILGGVNPGEGAVITREGALSLHLWTLDQAIKNSSFFVIETNYDHWEPPPFF